MLHVAIANAAQIQFNIGIVGSGLKEKKNVTSATNKLDCVGTIIYYSNEFCSCKPLVTLLCNIKTKKPT